MCISELSNETNKILVCQLYHEILPFIQRRLGMIDLGNKVANAARRGAIGVILYPDPEDFAKVRENNSKVFLIYLNTSFCICNKCVIALS